jgi:hypothetical protein
MRSKPCRLIDEHLVDFIEHKASADLQKNLQSHIEECPRCKQRVTEFSELWSKLSPQFRKEPSFSLWPSLEQAIRECEAHPFRFSEIYRGFVRTLRPAAMSLIIIIGIFFGFQIGNTPDNSELEPLQSNLRPGISPEIYFSQYLEDFKDIPLDSTAAFYLGDNKPDEDKTP